MAAVVWNSVLLTFLYFSAFFVVAQIIKNNSIVDIGWGVGFVLLAWYSLLGAGYFTPRAIVVTVLTSVWGLRLFYHILKRNIGKPEDFRYANWRREWGSWVVVRAFFQVFMLQALVMTLVAAPILLVNVSPLKGLNYLDILGVAIWVTGFFFEAVGDKQLADFLKNSSNRGKVLNTGLWRYSRHPNYFGEATMWWGLAIIALSVKSGWMAVISPVIITFLLRFVSGVPMLEKKMMENPEFREYAARTSVFIPWFPKQ